MKLVLAFVQPFKLDDVTMELERISGFPGLSVAPVRGFGGERLNKSDSQDDTLEDFSDKVQIEAVVPDHQVDEVIASIAHAAHTGRYGDGMIFILPVERTFRIATLTEGSRTL